jgi:hypothetical protein
MNIIEFLEARLTEDEQAARLPGSEPRLLCEVEAKRRIMAERNVGNVPNPLDRYHQ